MSFAVTVQNAVALSAVHTLLYVGVLYVRAASRPSLTTTKDNPSVIKARFAAVAVACVISVVANRYFIKQAREVGQKTGLDDWDTILEGWGEWKVDLRQTIHALGLTAFLFLGPLIERLWIQQGWRYFWKDLHYSVTSIFGWRTYIIVHPRDALKLTISGTCE
jgi:prenyl protein peptidase